MWKLKILNWFRYSWYSFHFTAIILISKCRAVCLLSNNAALKAKRCNISYLCGSKRSEYLFHRVTGCQYLLQSRSCLQLFSVVQFKCVWTTEHSDWHINLIYSKSKLKQRKINCLFPRCVTIRDQHLDGVFSSHAFRITVTQSQAGTSHSCFLYLLLSRFCWSL